MMVIVAIITHQVEGASLETCHFPHNPELCVTISPEVVVVAATVVVVVVASTDAAAVFDCEILSSDFSMVVSAVVCKAGRVSSSCG